MKLKIAALLLALSTIFSANAVIVKNETSKEITLERFGLRKEYGIRDYEKLEPVQLTPGEEVDLEGVDKLVVDIGDEDYTICRYLFSVGRLTFIENENGQIVVKK